MKLGAGWNRRARPAPTSHGPQTYLAGRDAWRPARRRCDVSATGVPGGTPLPDRYQEQDSFPVSGRTVVKGGPTYEFHPLQYAAKLMETIGMTYAQANLRTVGRCRPSGGQGGAIDVRVVPLSRNTGKGRPGRRYSLVSWKGKGASQ
jgi:hypothetical protein